VHACRQLPESENRFVKKTQAQTVAELIVSGYTG
jgi:hypothetical protein